MSELPIRKSNRLKGYDYSQNGAYFVTICAKDCAELFGRIIVGAASCRPQLSEIGEIVESEILRLSHTYNGVSVDYYVVMPNHVHMIIAIYNEDGRQNAAPCIFIPVVVSCHDWGRKQLVSPLKALTLYRRTSLSSPLLSQTRH